MKRYQELVQRLATIIYPKRCPYCGSVIPVTISVCLQCRDDIPKISLPRCILCGHAKTDCYCKNKRNSYKAIIAPYYYQGAVKKAILRLKFQNKPYVVETLASEMISCIQTEYSKLDFDSITCIPMTKAKLAQRGYNQSGLLAKEIGKALNIPCDEKLLIKLYDVPAQHTLKSSERHGNVLGIFDVAANRDVQGKTILLCDDIKTTGATSNECAKILLAAGAQEVYCVCAAITK